ncbi:MAG: peptidylprolyl isomerase [Treponema sp.]|nr:peptidylprolyl isomerase [Treponema sp.]
MTITKDKFAAFHYTLRDANGVELDSSAGIEPLGYVHGRGYLIPGLEAQLEGKAPGDKFSCTIQPKDGYGERDERLVAELSKDRFETDAEIEVGMQFQVMTPAGPTIVTVIEVNGDRVKIDGNHEMAGKILNFDIEVVEVRDTTEEELAQLESGCGGCGGNCGGCGSNEECGGCGGNEGCGDCVCS